jgi:PIN domain nuclease of toxin-antitoxin system
VKLLLDTHTLLWYTLGDPQLSATATALILDPANEILVSPASYWEIAIKVSIGKLSLRQPYEDFLDACLNRYGFLVLPIEPRHTVRVAALPYPPGHKDPFDRLLVAQALVEGIPLVSGDVALDAYCVNRLW